MRQRDDLGPTAWNCHLHPSLHFSGSSNHLIHAFLAVASLGNLCPPKLLHLGTQHSIPRLFLLRLSMPPTATHQQDNSYGGSAIWRVSKFVIPLIDAHIICWHMQHLSRRLWEFDGRGSHVWELKPDNWITKQNGGIFIVHNQHSPVPVTLPCHLVSMYSSCTGNNEAQRMNWWHEHSLDGTTNTMFGGYAILLRKLLFPPPQTKTPLKNGISLSQCMYVISTSFKTSLMSCKPSDFTCLTHPG